MIRITPDIELDEEKLEFDFVRSSGPGGQNVNKVSTAVQLRFDPSGLPDGVRERLLVLAGRRAAKDGTIRIKAHRHRTQAQNRRDAVQRLVDLLLEASRPPKRRRPTRPSRAAHERRLEQKRRRSRVKNLRGPLEF